MNLCAKSCLIALHDDHTIARPLSGSPNTVHGNELGLFWAKAFHYSNYSSRAPYKAAVETAIKVFGYDAVATT